MVSPLKLSSGWVLFHSDNSDQSITDAREYIKRMGLTGSECRIIRRDGAIMVIAKQEIEI